MLVHKMRAVLKNNESTITFIWGEGSDILHDHVKVKVQNQGGIAYDILSVWSARKYWADLIHKGYRIHDLLLL